VLAETEVPPQVIGEQFAPRRISWQPCIDYSACIPPSLQFRHRLAAKFVPRQIVWQLLVKFAGTKINKSQHQTRI